MQIKINQVHFIFTVLLLIALITSMIIYFRHLYIFLLENICHLDANCFAIKKIIVRYEKGKFKAHPNKSFIDMWMKLILTSLCITLLYGSFTIFRCLLLYIKFTEVNQRLSTGVWQFLGQCGQIVGFMCSNMYAKWVEGFCVFCLLFVIADVSLSLVIQLLYFLTYYQLKDSEYSTYLAGTFQMT